MVLAVNKIAPVKIQRAVKPTQVPAIATQVGKVVCFFISTFQLHPFCNINIKKKFFRSLFFSELTVVNHRDFT